MQGFSRDPEQEIFIKKLQLNELKYNHLNFTNKIITDISKLNIRGTIVSYENKSLGKNMLKKILILITDSTI